MEYTVEEWEDINIPNAEKHIAEVENKIATMYKAYSDSYERRGEEVPELLAEVKQYHQKIKNNKPWYYEQLDKNTAEEATDSLLQKIVSEFLINYARYNTVTEISQLREISNKIDSIFKRYGYDPAGMVRSYMKNYLKQIALNGYLEY